MKTSLPLGCSKRASIFKLLCALSLLCLAVPGAALHAQSLSWTGVGTDWTNVNDWTPNSVPTSSNTAVFSNAGVTAAQTVNLNASESVLGIQVANSQTGSVSIYSSGGSGVGGANTLTIGTGGVSTGTAGGLTFNNNVALNGNQTWSTAATGGGITMNGSFSGAGNLTVNETQLQIGFTNTQLGNVTGTMTLNAGGGNQMGTVNANLLNTFSGGFIVGTGAFFTITGAGFDDTQNLTFSGGINFYNTSNSNYIFNGSVLGGTAGGGANVAENSSGTFTFGGTTDNTGLQWTVNANSVTVLGKTSSATVHAIGAGGVALNSGTLQFAGSGSNQIYFTGNVSMGSSTLLDLNGNTEYFNDLTSSSASSTVTNTLANSSGTLALGANNGSATFAGDIQNGASGSGTVAITMVGTGTNTFSGASTYTGATNINAGTLVLGGTLGTGAGTAITVAGGATFTENAAGSVAGGSRLTSSGITTLSGTNTYTGATSVTGGTMTVNSGATSGSNSAYSLSGGAKLLFANAGAPISLSTSASNWQSSSDWHNNPVDLATGGQATGANGTGAPGTYQVGANGGSPAQPDFILINLGQTYDVASVSFGAANGANALAFYVAPSTESFSSLYTANGHSAGSPSMINSLATNFILDSGTGLTAGSGGYTSLNNYTLSGSSGEYLLIYITQRVGNSYGLDMANLTLTAAPGAVTQTIGSLSSSDPTTSVNLNSGVTLDTGGNNTSTTFAGSIIGPGNLAMVGTGTFTLSGTSTLTGAVTAANGNLAITGSLASPVNVTPGYGAPATLSGNGIISGTVITAAASGPNVAHIAPGVNVSGANNNFGNAGTLHLNGGLSIGNGTNLDFDLGTSSDLIAVTGGLTLGSGVMLNINQAAGFAVGTQYTLFSYTGSLAGSTSGWSVTGAPSGDTAIFSTSVGGVVTVTIVASNNSALTITPSPISLGDVLVGYTPANVSGTITNNGTLGTGTYTLVATGSASASGSGTLATAGGAAAFTVGTTGALSGASGNNKVIGTVYATNSANVSGSAAAVNVTANLYQAYAGSTSVSSGTNLVLTTGSSTDGGQRAGITVSNFAASNPNFTVTTANGGAVGNATATDISQTVATVGVASNRLSGTYTYTGSVTGSAAYTDLALAGQGTVANQTWSGISVTGTVTGATSSGTADVKQAYVAMGSSYTGYGLTSLVTGGKGQTLNPTVAQIIASDNASGNTTVDMNFSANGGHPVNIFQSSDTLTLSGINPTGAPGHDGSIITDTFVLQMSYVTNANVTAAGGGYYIGWWDQAINGNTGLWVNAIAGNSNAVLGRDYVGSGEFLGSYETYITTGSGNGKTLDQQLGAFGYDPTTDTAWAVLDHNSDFEVIPEPGTYAMIFSGFGMLIGFQRIRRHSRIGKI